MRRVSTKVLFVLSVILELIISPFTILFRIRRFSKKDEKKEKKNREVQFAVIALVSILITALLVFVCYYAKDVFKW